MNNEKNKGFLGPIGDDLPSLIPLLFALMLFFYAFTSAWNNFDKRNEDFADDLAVLRVSNALRGNNYIAGIEKFNENCETAKGTQRMHFLAGLLPLPTGKGEQFVGIDTEKIVSGEPIFFEEFQCSSTEEMPALESEKSVVRFFPVALETKEGNDRFYVKPMLLVVIAWK
jgi:hypothetical protein